MNRSENYAEVLNNYFYGFERFNSVAEVSSNRLESGKLLADFANKYSALSKNIQALQPEEQTQLRSIRGRIKLISRTQSEYYNSGFCGKIEKIISCFMNVWRVGEFISAADLAQRLSEQIKAAVKKLPAPGEAKIACEDVDGVEHTQQDHDELGRNNISLDDADEDDFYSDEGSEEEGEIPLLTAGAGGENVDAILDEDRLYEDKQGCYNISLENGETTKFYNYHDAENEFFFSWEDSSEEEELDLQANLSEEEVAPQANVSEEEIVDAIEDPGVFLRTQMLNDVKDSWRHANDLVMNHFAVLMNAIFKDAEICSWQRINESGDFKLKLSQEFVATGPGTLNLKKEIIFNLSEIEDAQVESGYKYFFKIKNFGAYHQKFFITTYLSEVQMWCAKNFETPKISVQVGNGIYGRLELDFYDIIYTLKQFEAKKKFKF